MLPLAVVMLCKNLGVGPFGLVGTVGLTVGKAIVAAALNVYGALLWILVLDFMHLVATCLLLGGDAQTCSLSSHGILRM